MFDSDALEYLVRCKNSLKKVPQDVLKKRWVGNDAESWFETVTNSETWRKRINESSDWNINDLSASRLDRCELQKKISGLRSSKTISDEANKMSVIKMSVIEVFAWGDMKVPNARMVLPCIDSYQKICRGLLYSELKPVEAYKEFFVARHSGMFKGMGPSYYTKLIYFLGDHSGLILDQWTARSINKLCKEKVIKLKRNNDGNLTVCQSNGPERYERYLEKVENLRDKLKLDTLPKTEELIFSCSDQDNIVKNRLGQYHRICSAWRKYVRTGEKVLTADE